MALPQITWQDLEQLPEDGNRYEAIGGELYMTRPPSVRHQRISQLLAVALHRLLDEAGHGIVLSGPIGVEFPATGEGVQPDIVFVSNDRREIIGEDRLRGAPDLVVEILSRSTEIRDRGVKLYLYRRRGVAEYWIVDPEIEAIEVWRFDQDPDFTRYSNRPDMDRVPVRTGGEPATRGPDAVRGDAATGEPAGETAGRDLAGGSAGEIVGEIRLGDIFPPA